MAESTSTSEIPEASNRIPGCVTIFRMAIALWAAAITPVVVFAVLVFVFLSIAMVTEAVRADGFKFENILSPVAGGGFLAVYLAFYVPCFSLPCVMIFGIPASIIGYHLGLIRWWTCMLAGLLLSTILGGLFLWNSQGSSSANGVQYWINGMPTYAGLIQFAGQLVVIGAAGAIGGLYFWLVWQLLDRFSVSGKGNSMP